MSWYQRDIKSIFRKLNTSEEGLTYEEVKERLQQYGPNKLDEEEQINKLKVLLHQFMSPMSNPFLLYSLIAAFFAQLAVLYVPAFQWVFRTVPLTITQWVEVAFVSVTIIIIVEIDKWIRRK